MPEAWQQRGRPGRLLHATTTVEHVAEFGELYEEWNMYMSDERPTGVPADELALHIALDGAALDRKLAALAAMASQTRDLVATIGAELYALQVREEAFVDASVNALVTSGGHRFAGVAGG